MDEADALIERVLGAPRELTRDEVAEGAGLSVDEARMYWRAMGFADVGTAPAFTEEDLRALRNIKRLVQSGVLSEHESVEVVRSLGQSTARMADWQTGTLARLLARQGEIPDELDMAPPPCREGRRADGGLVAQPGGDAGLRLAAAVGSRDPAQFRHGGRGRRR